MNIRNATASQIAECMGSTATETEGAIMLDLLLANGHEETSDVDADEWASLVEGAVAEARERAFDNDCHLIAVPHQSPVAIWQPGTYTQSDVADLHIGFPVRNQDDIDAAMRWTGHRAFEVHAAAGKLASLFGLSVSK